MSLTLRHLNADTSWLISYNDFKILLDPWFFGPQTDFFRYFSTQEHAIPSSIQDINRDLGANIDAIVISHEFTDHCHEQTLRSLSSSIAVFATTNAFKNISRWRHFQYVYEIPWMDDRHPENFTLNKLSQQHAESTMPATISVGYIPEKGFMSLSALHGATCLSFLDANHHQWHSLLYIPHGCKRSSITDWLNQQSNIKVTVLLQGFHTVSNPIWLGGLLNYGCDEAAKLAIAVKARHWIATHDEDKKGSGLVSKFLKRNTSTTANAQLQLEKFFREEEANQSGEIPKIHDIENGQSLIIDLTA